MLRYPTVHLVERLPTISHTAICEIEFVVSDCKKKIWIGTILRKTTYIYSPWIGFRAVWG